MKKEFTKTWETEMTNQGHHRTTSAAYWGVSPAKRCLMMALSCLSDAQEQMGTSEEDRNLLGKIDRAKMVIINVMEIGVLEKILPDWGGQYVADDQDQDNCQ